MIEKLGPSLARTVVGDDYNPDFTYELETSDAGLRLIITDPKTGNETVRALEDTVESKHYDPMYDSERIEAIRTYRRKGIKAQVLSWLITALIVSGIFLLFTLATAFMPHIREYLNANF